MKTFFTLLLSCLSSLLFLALAGCMGVAPESANLSQDALSVPPERELPRAAWESAPAGCEDAIIEGAYELLGTEDESELRVVVQNERTVCVDSLEAIRRELSSIGQERVDLAIDAATFTISSHQSVLTRREEVMGDPSPQPNRPGWYAPGSGAAQGDPSPQPNQPTRPNPNMSDPSPQPNQPNNGGGTPPRIVLLLLGQIGDLH